MIGVLIVDDSAVVREVMQELLKRVHDIRVLGVAPDPIYAMARMEREWPDVIVLDVDMPRMDGISFLKQVMRERPTPIVICSSLAAQGTQIALDALAAGAVTIIAKPSGGVSSFLRASESELVQAVREASLANVRPRATTQASLKAITDASIAAADPAASAKVKKSTFTALKPVADPAAVADDPTLRAKRSTFSGLKPVPELTPGPVSASPGGERMVAIGISTGGIQALEFVLAALPRTAPGIVIVQHMPEMFTRGFAERLDRVCQLEVREARDGDVLARGRALIAPGGMHTQVQRVGTHYVIEVIDGPPVSRHRPSVDVLFVSVAAAAGPNALGIIMTGMGDDGARGLKEMYDAGAHTVAQDEASCVVFGMPKEALDLGGVRELLGLNQLPARIASFGGLVEKAESGR